MYGFGADSKGHWHHYWENNASAGAFRKTGVHDGDFEFNLTLTLASIEKISFFKGRWPWPRGEVGAAISNMQQNKARWRWCGLQPGLNAWICGGFGASHCCSAHCREPGRGLAFTLHMISYLQIAGNYQSVVGINESLLRLCSLIPEWLMKDLPFAIRGNRGTGAAGCVSILSSSKAGDPWRRVKTTSGTWDLLGQLWTS